MKIIAKDLADNDVEMLVQVSSLCLLQKLLEFDSSINWITQLYEWSIEK